MSFTDQSIVELYCESLDFISGSDSKFGSQRSIAFTDILSSNTASCPMVFSVANFNTKIVRFKLLNSSGSLLTGTISSTTTNYNSNWILVLECIGRNE